MKRRVFLKKTTAVSSVLLSGSISGQPKMDKKESYPSFELDEMTIAELQKGMNSGRFSAISITEKYLARIREIDQNGPVLNSVLELNPDALDIADQMDKERKKRGARGPLHGIPVIIKANINSGDKMATTAGSLALEGSIPSDDAFLVKQLRKGGAIILGKSNLSEWANFRSTRSSSGWSSQGGQTKNPYALDRNPCGSSSGSGAGVSANLCSVSVGTETNGSIVCPANANGIIGIKPTVGLVSRTGIIPISHNQDTAGPMARTVEDAAILLGVLSGSDFNDPKTLNRKGKRIRDYTPFLNKNGLIEARIGISRNYFGFHEKVDKLMENAISVLKEQGATVIDPANITTKGKYGDASFNVLLYEFKYGLNKYLRALGPQTRVKSLRDIIDFNHKNWKKTMLFFGQEILEMAEAKGSLNNADYKTALKKCQRLARTEGIDATLKTYKLDAIIAPTGGPAWKTDLITGDHFLGSSSSPAARSGYPNITVPAGFVFGLPVGISFFSGPFQESKLISLAYAFEQATKHRQKPRFRKTADLSLK